MPQCRSLMEQEFVFVYGTLRRETSSAMSALLEQYTEYSGKGVMQGRLYEVNGYPGAVESTDPAEQVRGALYRVIDGEKLWPALDAYEECAAHFPEPHEYVRKKALITTEEGPPLNAWVYLFMHDITDLHRIESGDYLLYLAGEKQNRAGAEF